MITNPHLKKSSVLLILLTKNNIICTLTTLTGKTLCWVTAGYFKTKGSKKINPATVFSITKLVHKINKNFGYINLHIKLKRLTKNKPNHKNLFIKHLKNIGCNVISFQEILLLPHNGCKSSNKRRI